MSLVNTSNAKTPQFRDEDYADWAFRFQHFLQGRNLWEVVDETKANYMKHLQKRVSPEKYKTLDQDQYYADRQREVMSYLVEAMVSKTKIAIIRSHKTPKLMWNALKSKYQGGSIKSEAVTRAQRKELDFKLSDYGGDIEKMVRAIDENAELLTNLGSPTNNQLTIVLKALEDSSVEELRTTATSIRIAGKSYDQAKPILIQLNERRKVLGSNNQTAKPEALFTSGDHNCRVWMKTGNCSRRQNCRWAHPPNSKNQNRQGQTRRSQPKDDPPNGNNICRDFQKGSCRRKNCRYHHVKIKCNTCGELGHGSKNCKTKDANIAESEPQVYCMFVDSSHSSGMNDVNNMVRLIADSGSQENLIRSGKLSKPSNMRVGTAGDEILHATSKGNAKIVTDPTVYDDGTKFQDENQVRLQDVHVVPGLRKNLLSLRKIVEAGHEVLLREQDWIIFSRNEVNCNGQVSLPVDPSTGYWYLEGHLSEVDANLADALATTSSKLVNTWHQRFMCRNKANIAEMITKKSATGFNKLKTIDCDVCPQGKQTQVRKDQRKKKPPQALKPNEVVHSDYCGPFPKTTSGCNGFVSYIDGATRRTATFLTKNKSDQETFYKLYKGEAEAKHGPIKKFHADGGGEYSSHEFANFLASGGTSKSSSAPNRPQENSIAERFNRTIQGMVRCALIRSKRSFKLWGACLLFATLLYNVLISNAGAPQFQGISPFEAWNGQEDAGKLQPRSLPLIFIGMNTVADAFLLYNPFTRRTCSSVNVLFDETDFTDYTVQKPSKPLSLDYCTYKPAASRPAAEPAVQGGDEDNTAPDAQPQSTAPQSTATDSKQQLYGPDGYSTGDDTTESSDTETHTYHRTAKDDGRVRRLIESVARIAQDDSTYDSTAPTDSTAHDSTAPTDFTAPTDSTRRYPRRERVQSLVGVESTASGIASANIATSAQQIKIPKTIRQARQSPQAAEWTTSINKEVQKLCQLNCWDPRPTSIQDVEDGATIVDTQIIFQLSKSKDGTSKKFKARLVGRGDKQVEGIDFDKVFSPVMRKKSFRVLISLALHLGLQAKQADIQTAFPHAQYDRLAYIRLPKGLLPHEGKAVHRLYKAIYGTKQANRLWHEKITGFLVSEGIEFKQLKSDPCIFVLNHHSHGWLLVGVYVDDFPYFGKPSAQKWFEDKLAASFKISHFGPLEWFLGLKIEYNLAEIFCKLSQPDFITEILKRAGLEDCKPRETPLTPGFKFEVCDCDGIDASKSRLYSSLVMACIYLSDNSCPGITYAVNSLSRFLAKPCECRWKALKHLLRFLSGSRDTGIIIRAFNGKIVIFADASWAEDPTTSRSTTGWISFMGGPVSWNSTLQRSAAKSTMEAEYMALADATCEAYYLSQLVSEILPDVESTPVVIYEDNQPCIRLAESQTIHKKAKHIRLRYHIVRDAVNSRDITVIWTPSSKMVADLLTKAPSKNIFKCLLPKLVGDEPLTLY